MRRPEDDDDDGIELERETQLRESDHLIRRPHEEEGKAQDDDRIERERSEQDER